MKSFDGLCNLWSMIKCFQYFWIKIFNSIIAISIHFDKSEHSFLQQSNFIRDWLKWFFFSNQKIFQQKLCLELHNHMSRTFMQLVMNFQMLSNDFWLSPDSSIGDLVTDSLTHSRSIPIWTTPNWTTPIWTGPNWTWTTPN